MENKFSKALRILFWCILITLMTCFFCIQFFHVDAYTYLENEIYMMNQASLVLEDGETKLLQRDDVSFLYREAKSKEDIVLRMVLPEIVGDNLYVAILTNEQDVSLYVDGEIRNKYNDKQYRLLGNYSASNVIMTPLDADDSGKEITVVYNTPLDNYAKRLSCPVIGTERAILTWIIQSNLGQIVSAVLLLAIGFMFLVFGLIMRINQRNDKGLCDLGVFSVLISVWLFCQSSLRPLYFRNIGSADIMIFLSIMLCPTPFMLFINKLMKGQYQKIYNGMIILSLGNFLLNIILQLTGIANVMDILVFTHITIFATCMVCLITFLKYENKYEMADPRAVGIGLIGFIFATLIEQFNIIVNYAFFVGKYLGLGILFFLLMLGYAAIKGMVVQEQDYQNALHASVEKSNFLANMSHEIRTPINTILGMDEMILRETQNSEIEHYANNIRSAGNTLLSIINDILDFTKMESGKMELANKRYRMGNLLNELIDSVSILAEEKGLALFHDISESMPSALYGDEVKIKQAITNVLTNAVKYTKYGSVTLKVYEENESIDETKLCFVISDTGIGIKEEDQKKIFHSFVRLEERRNRSIEGTGLGMAITKQIIDIMGGSIEVESEYGNGTTFTIKIRQRILDDTPIGKLEDWYQTGHRKTRTYIEQYHAKVKLLVVDDNEMNLEVIKGLLKKTGAIIETAESGSECLRLFTKNQYDMVLLDHMMPEMDGVETFQKLKAIMTERKVKTPVIALTANAVSGAREEYLSYGFADYISKPVEYKNLIDVIFAFLPDKIERKENIKSQEDEYAEYLEKNGIHMKNALKYAGNDVQQYIHLLSLFASQRGYEKKINLHEAYRRHLWKDYIVYVHGLKNSARTIGIDKLADMAYEHERHCKEGDIIFIHDHYEELIFEWNENVRVIKEYLQKHQEAEEDNEEIEPITGDNWQQKKEELLMQIQAFKKKDAMAIIQELMKSTTDQDKKDNMQKIYETLGEYDYELAEKLVREFL